MYGQPLRSEWAVTTHVAGKILAGERPHRLWAELHAPHADYSAGTVPALANQLQAVVGQQMKAAKDAALRALPSPLDILHELELGLHEYIKARLQEQYGTTEDGWWVQGVPLAIRQESVERREADPSRDEPFSYTYLVDLRAIVDKQWAVVDADLKRSGKSAEISKKTVLDSLQRANEIRNRYAHPVRAPKRGTPQYTNDLKAAQQALEVLSGLTRS
jgi:hypothetical protein